jgi:hypothetical protein
MLHRPVPVALRAGRMAGMSSYAKRVITVCRFFVGVFMIGLGAWVVIYSRPIWGMAIMAAGGVNLAVATYQFRRLPNF